MASEAHPVTSDCAAAQSDVERRLSLTPYERTLRKLPSQKDDIRWLVKEVKRLNTLVDEMTGDLAQYEKGLEASQRELRRLRERANQVPGGGYVKS